MKTPSRFLALLALTAFACAPNFVRAQDGPPPPDQGAPPPPDQGAPPPDQGGPAPDQGGGDDQGTSFQTFYDQLGDQGQWIQTDNYGYVFQPNVTDPDWAPYTDGHWVYTDAGWTWASDESWGWATYHYGRWANIDGTGWVWVPGYRWAPAWVSWRYGGGYAGWAPLPPETFVGVEYGGGGGWNTFHFGNDVDVSFGIGAGCYNFVNVGYLGERNYRGHYLDRGRNFTVINNTTNVTNINVTNNYYGGARGNFRNVSTGGPSLAEVNEHAHTHVQSVRLAEANQAGRSSLQGNSLAVYAPRMNAGTQHTARPAQVGQTIAHPEFNRGESITKPLAVTSTIKPRQPSADAIVAAQTAREHAPAAARVATESTPVHTQITQPLSSMAPVPMHHTANPGSSTQNGSTPEKPANHPSAESSFTGESQKPTPTYHPQTQTQNGGGQVYHPQAQAAPTSHPETQTEPKPTYHPQAQSEGGQVYHPQSQSQFQPSQTYHPQVESKPEPAFHPQTETAPTFHPQQQHEEAPAPSHHEEESQGGGQSFHPQAEPQHQSQPQPQHTQSAPAAKPAPAAANSGGNKNGQGQNQQGH